MFKPLALAFGVLATLTIVPPTLAIGISSDAEIDATKTKVETLCAVGQLDQARRPPCRRVRVCRPSRHGRRHCYYVIRCRHNALVPNGQDFRIPLA